VRQTGKARYGKADETEAIRLLETGGHNNVKIISEHCELSKCGYSISHKYI